MRHTLDSVGAAEFRYLDAEAPRTRGNGRLEGVGWPSPGLALPCRDSLRVISSEMSVRERQGPPPVSLSAASTRPTVLLHAAQSRLIFAVKVQQDASTAIAAGDRPSCRTRR